MAGIEEDWEKAFTMITDMVTIHDRDFNIIYANKSAEKILGLPSPESARAKCYEYYHGKGCPPEDCVSCQTLKTLKPAVAEIFEPHLNRFLEIRVTPRFDSNHELAGLIHVVRDVTDHKYFESMNEQLKTEMLEREMVAKKLEKVNRTLRTISDCHEALCHAANEQIFLNDICRIIINDGKYLMAWIGYPQTDKEKTVRPVAYAGYVDGYLDAVKVTWEDNEWGRGITGTAIRTGEAHVENNRLDSPNMAPWREEAARRGYASAISLPLRNEEKCFGALTIFSSASDVFIEAESKLLKELADDIAFGISVVRMRAKERLVGEQLRISNEHLRNLAAHLQTVREEERKNIAREIHDEFGQFLVALKCDLSWFCERYREHKLIFEKSEYMLHTLNATIQSVKRICTDLRPSLLDDFGLVAAMHWQANEFQNRSGIACTVKVEPDEIDPDQELTTMLFRIFQEALTNILKHAKATKVTAGLTQGNDSLILEVVDNGIGIKDDHLSKPQSFGLLGMRERVYPRGGIVRITSNKSGGTTVKVSIPYPAKKTFSD